MPLFDTPEAFISLKDTGVYKFYQHITQVTSIMERSFMLCVSTVYHEHNSTTLATHVQ